MRCTVEYTGGVPSMIMDIDDPPEVVLIIEKVLENIFYQSLDDKEKLKQNAIHDELQKESDFNNKKDLI